MAAAYKVKLDIFEGPLDLLLYLIKKSEIDIHNIPIAQITEQYLAYLELMEVLDLNVAGEFLVMAATLMQIKSQMLLPPDAVSVEEEEEDPREALVRQLLEYQRFKEAAAQLGELATRQQTFFRRPSDGLVPALVDSDEPFFEASLFDLLTAFSKIVKEIPKESFYQVIKDTFTIEDKVRFLAELLQQHPQVTFQELFGPGRSKLELVATFLALLELIRQRAVQARQNGIFGEIVFRKREIPPPARDPRSGSSSLEAASSRSAAGRAGGGMA